MIVTCEMIIILKLVGTSWKISVMVIFFLYGSCLRTGNYSKQSGGSCNFLRLPFGFTYILETHFSICINNINSICIDQLNTCNVFSPMLEYLFSVMITDVFLIMNSYPSSKHIGLPKLSDIIISSVNHKFDKKNKSLLRSLPGCSYFIQDKKPSDFYSAGWTNSRLSTGRTVMKQNWNN